MATPAKSLPNDQQEKPYTLEIDVDLVNVNVAVTDPFGKYLVNLKKENFRIFEDKVEQKITHFSPVDAPFCIGLLLDTSYSAVDKLWKIQDEAIHFTKQVHPDVADRLDSLGDVFARIATELRSQYALGYVSSNQKRDGKFRKIAVTVDQPNITVKAKKGYLAKKN